MQRLQIEIIKGELINIVKRIEELKGRLKDLIEWK